MGGFHSGLGFAILLFSLLFTWLTVATFVSPELAAFMGLAVMGIWAFLFLPLNFFREMIWQNRQKQIMAEIMRHDPVAYQAGTALPPPLHPNPNALSILEPSRGGALDVYRDLPQLPRLEPRPHATSFWRALALPVVGLMMFIGANNDTVIHSLLEARGLAQNLPVAWASLSQPQGYSSYKLEMHEAARMVLRRERECTRIKSGQMVGSTQFEPMMEQLEEGNYVYEFVCETSQNKKSLITNEPITVSYSTWISPAELNRGIFSTLTHALSRPAPVEALYPACRKAANVALEKLHGQLGLPAKPTAYKTRMPYPDYLRIVSTEQLVKNNAVVGTLQVSCWARNDGEAQIRIFKEN